MVDPNQFFEKVDTTVVMLAIINGFFAVITALFTVFGIRKTNSNVTKTAEHVGEARGIVTSIRPRAMDPLLTDTSPDIRIPSVPPTRR